MGISPLESPKDIENQLMPEISIWENMAFDTDVDIQCMLS